MQQKIPSLPNLGLAIVSANTLTSSSSLFSLSRPPSLPSAPVHTRFTSLYMAPQPSSLAQSNGATGATTSVQVGPSSSLSDLTHYIALTLQSSSENPSVEQSRPCHYTPSFPADHRSCCFHNFRLCRPAVLQSRSGLNSVHTSNSCHKETAIHF